MTIGDGIFYSTALLVLAGFVYVVSIKGEWKAAGKVFGVLVLTGLVIGGALVGYKQYQERPAQLVAVTEFIGIELGADKAGVTVAQGMPQKTDEPRQRDDKSFYQNLWYKGFYVILEGEETANLVGVVCSNPPFGSTFAGDLLGISEGDSEDRIVGLLGQPSSESIDRLATSKVINFKTLNAAFQMTKGSVSRICMTNSEI